MNQGVETKNSKDFNTDNTTQVLSNKSRESKGEFSGEVTHNRSRSRSASPDGVDHRPKMPSSENDEVNEEDPGRGVTEKFQFNTASSPEKAVKKHKGRKRSVTPRKSKRSRISENSNLDAESELELKQKQFVTQEKEEKLS